MRNILQKSNGVVQTVIRQKHQQLFVMRTTSVVTLGCQAETYSMFQHMPKIYFQIKFQLVQIFWAKANFPWNFGHFIDLFNNAEDVGGCVRRIIGVADEQSTIIVCKLSFLDLSCYHYGFQKLSKMHLLKF